MIVGGGPQAPGSPSWLCSMEGLISWEWGPGWVAQGISAPYHDSQGPLVPEVQGSSQKTVLVALGPPFVAM